MLGSFLGYFNPVSAATTIGGLLVGLMIGKSGKKSAQYGEYMDNLNTKLWEEEEEDGK